MRWNVVGGASGIGGWKDMLTVAAGNANRASSVRSDGRDLSTPFVTRFARDKTPLKMTGLKRSSEFNAAGGSTGP
jgi:hypothetical protein